MPRQIGEHRQVAVERASHQRQLDRVAALVAGAGARVALRAVQLGGDVVAADEHDALQQVEHVIGIVRQVRVGRDHQRAAAGQAGALDIAVERDRGPA